MQVEIKVDAEAVQQKLVQSLIDSAIGKQIDKAVTDMLSKSFGTWDSRETLVENAVRGALQEQLRRIVNEMILARGEELRALVAQKLTDEVMQKAAGAIVSKLYAAD